MYVSDEEFNNSNGTDSDSESKDSDSDSRTVHLYFMHCVFKLNSLPLDVYFSTMQCFTHKYAHRHTCAHKF